MGKLYITGYRQALTWSPIIQVSLTVLMSTEEPSKTCLLLKKQLSSLNKNTANVLVWYIWISALYSGLKGENNFVSVQLEH